MKRKTRILIILAAVGVAVALTAYALLPVVLPLFGHCGEPTMPVLEAKNELSDKLSHDPHIGPYLVAVGYSREGFITVAVETEEALRKVPRCYRGWPVYRNIGKPMSLLHIAHACGVAAYGEDSLSSLYVDPVRWSEYRPLIGGISIGDRTTGGIPKDLLPLPFDDTVGGVGEGTLGMITYDNKILSAAHVIAFSGSLTRPLGARVYQPAGSQSEVGKLEKVMPITISSTANNLADAAIAGINQGIEAIPGEVFGEDQSSFTVNGWTTVCQGDTVRKSGVKTGITTTTIVDDSHDIIVYYGTRQVRFIDQYIVISYLDYDDILSSVFAFFGDSGSAVVDDNNRLVGLVLGGEYCWPESNYCICGKYGQYLPGYDGTCQGIFVTSVSKAEHIVSGLGISMTPPGGGGGGSPPPIYMTGKDPPVCEIPW